MMPSGKNRLITMFTPGFRRAPDGIVLRNTSPRTKASNTALSG